MKIQAFSKINLYLEVSGKRADGYHNLNSIMLAVNLCDDLKISAEPAHDSNSRENNQIQLQIINASPAGLGGIFHIPKDERNLVVKAAKMLVDLFAIKETIKIELTKRIPVGAGLAGGSSDCAATLLGINKLLNLNIPISKLFEIGKSLGADVPFCLHAIEACDADLGNMALTQGIGEIISPLPLHPPCHILIACPKIHVSTAKIFAKLKNHNENPAGLEKILTAVNEKNLHAIARSLHNVFTPITSNLHPEIATLISNFKSAGAIGAEMSGTGSSVFAYFDNENTAVSVLNKMKKFDGNVFLCKPV